jgi:hypothetical protein
LCNRHNIRAIASAVEIAVELNNREGLSTFVTGICAVGGLCDRGGKIAASIMTPRIGCANSRPHKTIPGE